MLKVLQINIEGDRHLDQVKEFVAKEQPAVACMQEIYEETFAVFQEAFGMRGVFAPMGVVEQDGAHRTRGIAIMTKLPVCGSGAISYWKTADSIGPVVAKDETEFHRAVVHMAVEQDDVAYTVLTTHFPPSHDGFIVSDFQKSLERRFREIITGFPSFMLAADMNCPRGTAIFDALAESYADNIPASIISTLDPVLHRIQPPLEFVVDCFFTTPDIDVVSIRLEGGVSDHNAIIATVSKR